MPARAASPSHAGRRPRAVRVAVALLSVWLLTLGLLYVAGYRTLVVHSASMAPAVDTGDLVITRAVAPATVAVGDVVSFHDRSREGRLVTHRVTKLRRDGQRVAFVTRGDVNTGTEHWSSDRGARVGKLALRVPLVGYAVTWLTRPLVVFGLLAIVLALFASAVLGARATRRTRRGVVRASLAGMASVAAIVSAPIMLGTTEGAFSATSNSSGTFAAAATFCATAPRVLNATADTDLTQENPTTNNGGGGGMRVESSSGKNFRSLVRFALPVAPVDPHCPMTSAVLEVTSVVSFGFSGRTLDAKRVTASWSEMGVTWGTQPTTTDVDLAAAPSTTGAVDFDVTNQVASMYAGTNNGILIRDSVENFVGLQYFYTREAGRPATLTITYG